MKKKLIRVIVVFVVILAACLAVFYKIADVENHTDSREMEIVILNEIENLCVDAEGKPLAEEPIAELRERIQRGSLEAYEGFVKGTLLFVLFFVMFFMAVIFMYVYEKMLKPFEKLEQYAEKIAGGDLEATLQYERTNYFGAFTWAFDHMRKEIIHARKKEKEAVEENKTVIAALSHDILTPIASVRAYAEGLEANLDTNYEKRQHYVSIIMRKCDEVTALVKDLTLHSLTELDKLDIKCTDICIHEVIRKTAEELEFPNMRLAEPLCEGHVLGDAKRIAQMIENLLNNAKKYAPGTEVLIDTEISAEHYFVHVRDHGGGIPPQDMPFVVNKFYRGKNAGDMPGSGLGLYIVNYMAERMQGGLELHNSPQGLDAVFFLSLIMTFPVNQ